MSINMENAAYSKEYIAQRKIISDVLFNEKNKTDNETIEISKELKIECQNFENHPGKDFEYNIAGSINYLYRNNELVHFFQCLDNGCMFYKLIKHSNGLEYLMYRKDLYGYSILELKSLKEFDYFPACNVNYRISERIEETFIWTNVLYNEITNVLAVYGCYWACSWELVLVDFKDPFAPAENQVVTSMKADLGSIDTYEWKAEKLILNSTHSTYPEIPKGQSYCYNDIKDRIIREKKTHIIEKDEYLKWLKEGNDFDE